jgi:hypothetical protein
MAFLYAAWCVCVCIWLEGDISSSKLNQKLCVVVKKEFILQIVLCSGKKILIYTFIVSYMFCLSTVIFIFCLESWSSGCVVIDLFVASTFHRFIFCCLNYFACSWLSCPCLSQLFVLKRNVNFWNISDEQNQGKDADAWHTAWYNSERLDWE